MSDSMGPELQTLQTTKRISADSATSPEPMPYTPLRHSLAPQSPPKKPEANSFEEKVVPKEHPADSSTVFASRMIEADSGLSSFRLNANANANAPSQSYISRVNLRTEYEEPGRQSTSFAERLSAYKDKARAANKDMTFEERREAAIRKLQIELGM